MPPFLDHLSLQSRGGGKGPHVVHLPCVLGRLCVQGADVSSPGGEQMCSHYRNADAAALHLTISESLRVGVAEDPAPF